MIYVALGTQDKEFKRLIDIVKNFLEETNSEEEIIIQYGNTKYDYSFFDNFPNVKYFDFISPDVFDKYMIEADVVVTHAGVGTIINGLKKKNVFSQMKTLLKMMLVLLMIMNLNHLFQQEKYQLILLVRKI